MTTDLKSNQPKKRGGARPGAGRKKGSASALTKEEGRATLRNLTLAELPSMVHAQIANAKGIYFLVVREKATGKFLRVAQKQAEQLNPTEEIIEVWQKDPSVQSFTDLLNRALDKPVEQVEVQVSGELAIVEGRLRTGLRRVREARKQ